MRYIVSTDLEKTFVAGMPRFNEMASDRCDKLRLIGRERAFVAGITHPSERLCLCVAIYLTVLIARRASFHVGCMVCPSAKRNMQLLISTARSNSVLICETRSSGIPPVHIIRLAFSVPVHALVSCAVMPQNLCRKQQILIFATHFHFMISVWPSRLSPATKNTKS